MKRAVIYKITSPSGKLYIGKTVDFDSRITNYRNLNCHQQKAIYASILKYGWENHTVEILEESNPDKLNELEVKYIREYNSFKRDNPLGLNLTRGGEGSLGRKDTDEVKKKRANKHIGTKRSSEARRLMSDKKKGKVPFASTLPRSEKQLYHSKFGNLGRKKSKEAAQKEMQTKLANFLNKFGGILQYTIDGRLVKEWQMLPKQVAKEVKLDDSYLLTVLKSTTKKTAKGFLWKFKTQPE